MKKIFRDKVFYALGVYFIIFGALSVLNASVYTDTAYPLWFCYIAMFLVGIGFLKKDSNLIFMQLNIIFIPFTFWNIDFFYNLFTGNSLWGITDYFFEGGLNSLGDFITLQHLYTIPLLLIGLYFFKVKDKNVWWKSMIEISLVYVFSYFFAPALRNVNCVRESCVDFVRISGIYYYCLWFIGMFAMILLTNFLVFSLMKWIGRVENL